MAMDDDDVSFKPERLQIMTKMAAEGEDTTEILKVLTTLELKYVRNGINAKFNQSISSKGKKQAQVISIVECLVKIKWTIQHVLNAMSNQNKLDRERVKRINREMQIAKKTNKMIKVNESSKSNQFSNQILNDHWTNHVGNNLPPMIDSNKIIPISPIPLKPPHYTQQTTMMPVLTPIPIKVARVDEEMRRRTEKLLELNQTQSSKLDQMEKNQYRAHVEQQKLNVEHQKQNTTQFEKLASMVNNAFAKQNQTMEQKNVDLNKKMIEISEMIEWVRQQKNASSQLNARQEMFKREQKQHQDQLDAKQEKLDRERDLLNKEKEEIKKAKALQSNNGNFTNATTEPMMTISQKLSNRMSANTKAKAAEQIKKKAKPKHAPTVHNQQTHLLKTLYDQQDNNKLAEPADAKKKNESTESEEENKKKDTITRIMTRNIGRRDHGKCIRFVNNIAVEEDKAYESLWDLLLEIGIDPEGLTLQTQVVEGNEYPRIYAKKMRTSKWLFQIFTKTEMAALDLVKSANFVIKMSSNKLTRAWKVGIWRTDQLVMTKDNDQLNTNTNVNANGKNGRGGRSTRGGGNGGRRKKRYNFDQYEYDEY
eukprot:105792_1